MSEDDFLTRWSRRKREVAATEKAAPVADVKPAERKDADESLETDAEVRAKIEAPLPLLESITELSDITAFLKAGVPADLTRAALRRVWTVDPSIRDFIGLAENSWDFTDPAAMPGFGPLEDTEQVRRMIAQVVDQIGQAAKPVSGEPISSPETSSYSNTIVAQSSEEPAPQEQALRDDAKSPNAQVVGNEVLLHGNKEDVAMQHNPTEEQEKPKQFVHRGHGSALPQ
ncbi:MAG: DUF3306 domain-containing protein [Xanthobacteraceae bacterium]